MRNFIDALNEAQEHEKIYKEVNVINKDATDNNKSTFNAVNNIAIDKRGALGDNKDFMQKQHDTVARSLFAKTGEISEEASTIKADQDLFEMTDAEVDAMQALHKKTYDAMVHVLPDDYINADNIYVKTDYTFSNHDAVNEAVLAMSNDNTFDAVIDAALKLDTVAVQDVADVRSVGYNDVNTSAFTAPTEDDLQSFVKGEERTEKMFFDNLISDLDEEEHDADKEEILDLLSKLQNIDPDLLARLKK